MTDETDNELDDEHAPRDKAPEGPLAGERLAAARREQQITVVEVAKELHLDEPKVRALEQNDFEMLGAPVFAKGHLRKYAALVGVDMDDVLQDYYRLTRAQGMPPVVGKIRKPASEMSPGPWIIAIVVLIIAATAYWWLVARDTGPVLPAAQPPPATLPDNSFDDSFSNSSGIDTVEVVLPQMPELDEAVATQSDNEVTLAPAVVVESAPPTTVSGEVRLSMSFSGECWTEITDANGRRLFFDLGRAGRNVSVSGQAPLSVLLGNADNVSVQVNGDEYEIQAADRRGETARFTVLSP